MTLQETTDYWNLWFICQPHILLSLLLQCVAPIHNSFYGPKHVGPGRSSCFYGRNLHLLLAGSNSIPLLYINSYSWNICWNHPASHTHTHLCGGWELGSVNLQSAAVVLRASNIWNVGWIGKIWGQNCNGAFSLRRQKQPRELNAAPVTWIKEERGRRDHKETGR